MRGFITDPASPSGLRFTDDLPEPVALAHEAVIEVFAFSVNPGELALIKARPSGFRPGQDVAGTIVRPAADGTGPPAGTRVVGYPDWHGWAERVAVPVTSLAVLDDEVSFHAAATLPVSGLTALRALRVGGSLLGRRVLITGATGGVGHFAVQLAAAAGADVTAQARRTDHHKHLRDLGANEVVVSLTNLEGFHLVLDGVAGVQLADAVRLLRPGASLVLYAGGRDPSTISLGDFYRAGAHNARIIGFTSTIPEETKGEDLAALVALVAQDRLFPTIGWTANWTKAPAALAALSAREYHGKAILTIEPTSRSHTPARPEQ